MLILAGEQELGIRPKIEFQLAADAVVFPITPVVADVLGL